jgi:hypothetical protein
MGESVVRIRPGTFVVSQWIFPLGGADTRCLFVYSVHFFVVIFVFVDVFEVRRDGGCA